MVSVFMTVSCKAPSVTAAVAESEKFVNVYQNEYINIPDGYTVSRGDVTYYDGYIYYIGVIYITGEQTFDYNRIYSNINPQYVLFSRAPDGETKSVSLGDIDKNIFKCIYADANGIFACTRQAVYVFSTDLKLKSSILLSGVDEDMWQVTALRTDAEGNIYLLSNSFIVILDSNGDTFYSGENNDGIKAIEVDGSGEVVFSRMRINPSIQMEFYYYDFLKKTFTKTDFTPPSNVTKYDAIFSVAFADGFDIYYINSSGVFGYDFGSSEAVPLCNWLNSDIYYDYTSVVKIINRETIICAVTDPFTNAVITPISNCDIAVMTRIPDDKVVPKTNITLAFTVDLTDVKAAAISFNMKSDKYHIAFDDYTGYGETLGNTEKLNLAITTGIIPDILLIPTNDGSINYKNYAEKGLFCDLYEFLDKDTELCRDDILYCIRSAFDTGGKLYYIPTSFYINTLASKRSMTADDFLTLDSFFSLATETPVEGSVIAAGNYKDAVYQFINSAMNEFIDYEAKICSFNDGRFNRLIKLFDGMPVYNGEFANTCSPAQLEWLQNNNSSLINVSINNPEAFVAFKYIFGNEPYSLIGFPSKNGNGAELHTNFMFSITEQSENKNAAWEFIKYFVSVKGTFVENRVTNDLPIITTAFESAILNLIGRYYYVNYTDRLELRYSTEEISGFGASYAITQKEAEEIIKYMNSVQISDKSDRYAMSIIKEELSTYYAGATTLDHAIELIQNRVSIYINE